MQCKNTKLQPIITQTKKRGNFKMTRIKRKSIFLVTLCLVMLFATVSYASTVPNSSTRNAASYGRVKKKDSSKPQAMTNLKKKSINLSKYGLDGSLKYFHGMFYEAKTTKTVNAEAVDGKGDFVINKKASVIVMKTVGHKSMAVVRAVIKQKSKTLYRTGKISTEYLNFKKYIYNSSSKYTEAQIEEWVNSHNITSSTDWLVFVSGYNQSLWIMKKYSGRWEALTGVGCATGGQFGSYGGKKQPNDIFGWNSLATYARYDYLERIGGRAITYTGKYGGNSMHTIGRVGRPGTHGCIACKKKDYRLIWNLPINSRVVKF